MIPLVVFVENSRPDSQDSRSAKIGLSELKYNWESIHSPCSAARRNQSESAAIKTMQAGYSGEVLLIGRDITFGKIATEEDADITA